MYVRLCVQRVDENRRKLVRLIEDNLLAQRMMNEIKRAAAAVIGTSHSEAGTRFLSVCAINKLNCRFLLQTKKRGWQWQFYGLYGLSGDNDDDDDGNEQRRV